MKLSPRLPRYFAFYFAGLFTAGTLVAAVVDDPALASGPGRIIAETNGINVRAPGSVNQGSLDERSDFHVLQNFPGFEAGTNIANFSSDDQPDIQVSFGDGFIDNSGSLITNKSFFTSAGNSIRVSLPNPPAPAGSFTFKIEFGEYDAAAGEVNPGGASVSLASFTLAGVTERWQRVESIEATFLSEEGKVLGTQKIDKQAITDPSQPTQRVLFAFESTGGESIGEIAVKFETEESGDDDMGPIFGLDDIGFAVGG